MQQARIRSTKKTAALTPTTDDVKQEDKCHRDDDHRYRPMIATTKPRVFVVVISLCLAAASLVDQIKNNDSIQDWKSDYDQWKEEGERKRRRDIKSIIRQRESSSLVLESNAESLKEEYGYEPRMIRYAYKYDTDNITENDNKMDDVDNDDNYETNNNINDETAAEERLQGRRSIDTWMEHMDVNKRYPVLSGVPIYGGEEIEENQRGLQNSKDKNFQLADEWEHGNCKAQHGWQKSAFPTCNNFHELDLPQQFSEKQFYPVGHGSYREVFRISNNNITNIPNNDHYYSGTSAPPSSQLALKMLAKKREYSVRNYDRHRRDAVSALRLTSSPRVADIYGHCSNSALYEFADGGTLDTILKKHGRRRKSIRRGFLNNTQRLILAYQVAGAIADTHNTDEEGKPTIAHTDIKESQFIYNPTEGRLKLNDFNRCRLLAWDEKRNKICTFTVSSNKGTGRAPEEYKYLPETNKVDIYSMGNVFYRILTGRDVFDDISSTSEAIKKVIRGETPTILRKNYVNATKDDDVAVSTLITAMKMCWIYDPKKRANARQVQRYIQSQLKDHHSFFQNMFRDDDDDDDPRFFFDI